MGTARKLEAKLETLHALRSEPHAEASQRAFAAALRKDVSHAAAAAAQIAADFSLAPLETDLVAAFDRFMVNPEKRDPGCTAKSKIVDALTRVGHGDERVFLEAISHVQMEPVWGGRVDTAGELRSAASLGLVGMNHPDVLSHLAELLADPLDQVRAAAARALAYHGSDFGAPLLRLKILCGDTEERVLSECLVALLRLAGARALPFAERLLEGAGPMRAELVAFALGESGLPEAFEPLRRWWDRARDPDRARTALDAIATLRRDDALDFLVGLVAEAPGPVARDAIAALAIQRDDEALAARVRHAALAREDADLRGAVEELL